MERLIRLGLIIVAAVALAVGLAMWATGHAVEASRVWAIGTIPVVAGLAVSITRDFLAGRVGVDAIALVSMTAALLLGEALAGIVVAVMYAGGNVLEDFAVARAERDLKSLVDRAPRLAHRRSDHGFEDIPVEQVGFGDVVLVRAGEIVPIDGVVVGGAAVIDESALTGEPIPVTRRTGEQALSGALNAGETFEMRTTANAGASTYAGIVRMVTAAQTAKAPFIRVADRYALLLLPVTLAVAGAAWLLSGDSIRGLAVLVAATPCPLILAAPVAFIAGVSQAARSGILIKGGGALEALARTHTVMFDKTGTLTVGGARLIAVETAPGETSDEVLRLAGSLEHASHHIVAAAIVDAALARGLAIEAPHDVRETMGSGLEGFVGGRKVCVGSHQLVHGVRRPEQWALHVLRRASWRSALSVFVAVDGRTIGALLLGDELRRETPRAVQTLRTAGVSRILMVTGDRADAVVIAKRARAIAVQSIVAGLAMSGGAMGLAAFGWLSPVAGALTQEAIDVAVILNALRALVPARAWTRPQMPSATATALRHEHESLDGPLDRLREIADALDDAEPVSAVRLIAEANDIISGKIVTHERTDETKVYPRLARFLADGHGLGAMSRAHREILHLARLIGRLSKDLEPADADRYVVRDAQRVIESIESLVRLHNAQEEDIYEHAAQGVAVRTGVRLPSSGPG